MALTAQSKAVNIEKSLNVYFHTNLVTGDSLDVHFPGMRGIFEPSGATWVQISYLLGAGRQFVGPADDDLNKGNLTTGIINLNCSELIDQRSGVSYALATLRDAVRARVTEGTAIGIQDYDTSGNPGVGHFVILDVTETQIQSGLDADDGGISVWNISASGQYIEAYT